MILLFRINLNNDKSRKKINISKKTIEKIKSHKKYLMYNNICLIKYLKKFV